MVVTILPSILVICCYMTNDPKLSGLKQHLLSTFSIDQKSNTNLAKSFALESVMAELYPVLNSFV